MLNRTAHRYIYNLSWSWSMMQLACMPPKPPRFLAHDTHSVTAPLALLASPTAGQEWQNESNRSAERKSPLCKDSKPSHINDSEYTHHVCIDSSCAHKVLVAALLNHLPSGHHHNLVAILDC